MSTTSKSEILKRSQILKYAKGAHICRQGQKDRRLFVTLKGTVGVYKKTHRNYDFITELGINSVFGEIGFFVGYMRTADVVALEKSIFLEISYPTNEKEESTKVREFVKLKDRIRIHQAIVSSTMFSRVPLEAVDQLAAIGKIVDFSIGTQIIREGEIGRNFYVIVEGSLDVTIKGNSIRTMGKGDFFGEIALFQLRPRTATVKGLTKGRLLQINENEFWAVLSSHVGLAYVIESFTDERVKMGVS